VNLGNIYQIIQELLGLLEFVELLGPTLVGGWRSTPFEVRGNELRQKEGLRTEH
jgi:hypothetical protein